MTPVSGECFMAAIRFILAGFIITAATVRAPAQEPPVASSDGEGVTDRYADGDPWQETLKDFDQWVLVQRVYTPKQTAEMRAKILEKSRSLPPEEAAKLRGEIDAKLAILFSAEAREAREWLSSTLAVASDSYAQKIKAKIPDVAKTTPDQLQEELSSFEYRRSGVRQYQRDIQTSRETAAKAVQDDARRQAKAAAKARSVPTYNPAPGGPAMNVQKSHERYHSPYALKDPYAPFFRFW
jgi:hypothetical protein